jgi:hypothetical protein
MCCCRRPKVVSDDDDDARNTINVIHSRVDRHYVKTTGIRHIR